MVPGCCLSSDPVFHNPKLALKTGCRPSDWKVPGIAVSNNTEPASKTHSPICRGLQKTRWRTLCKATRSFTRNKASSETLVLS